MTKEEKDLLLKDLCGRLPHGVKLFANYVDGGDVKEGRGRLSLIDSDLVIAFIDEIENNNSFTYVALHEVKPYLFPLSSMTEEQKNQLKEIWDVDMNKALDYAISGEEGLSDLFQLSAAEKIINWLDKNKFDYRGLIPKGLALDATNLNIY